MTQEQRNQIFNAIREIVDEVVDPENKMDHVAFDGVYVQETEEELTITTIPSDGFKKIENTQISEYISKGIDLCMKNSDLVYIYICKDNYLVSFEWSNLEELKEHLKYCDEVIPGLYYEGWD